MHVTCMAESRGNRTHLLSHTHNLNNKTTNKHQKELCDVNVEIPHLYMQDFHTSSHVYM